MVPLVWDSKLRNIFVSFWDQSPLLRDAFIHYELWFFVCSSLLLWAVWGKSYILYMFWVKLLGDCFLVPFKPILLVVAKLVQENGHPDKALCIANIGAGIMRLGTFNCSGRISVLRELALFFLQKTAFSSCPLPLVPLSHSVWGLEFGRGLVPSWRPAWSSQQLVCQSWVTCYELSWKEGWMEKQKAGNTWNTRCRFVSRWALDEWTFKSWGFPQVFLWHKHDVVRASATSTQLCTLAIRIVSFWLCWPWGCNIVHCPKHKLHLYWAWRPVRFSSAVSAVWYGLFGRMQFSLIGINDVIGNWAFS